MLNIVVVSLIPMLQFLMVIVCLMVKVYCYTLGRKFCS